MHELSISSATPGPMYLAKQTLSFCDPDAKTLALSSNQMPLENEVRCEKHLILPNGQRVVAYYKVRRF
jgi:hypothetical protein